MAKLNTGRKTKPLRRESDKMIILHWNGCVPNTKIGHDLNGIPGGRCVVGSPEVFGPVQRISTHSAKLLGLVRIFGWVGFFDFFFVCFHIR